MFMNHRNRLLILATALGGLAGLGQWVSRADTPKPDGKQPAARASKLDLTPETFAKFRDLVRPQGNEWRHLKVHWYTDIVAARKKAAQEDKPIVWFRTQGAGYNDPLGAC